MKTSSTMIHTTTEPMNDIEKPFRWVLRRHYSKDGRLLLIDTAPADAKYTTPLGEYSNLETRQALVEAGLRERVEKLN